MPRNAQHEEANAHLRLGQDLRAEFRRHDADGHGIRNPPPRQGAFWCSTRSRTESPTARVAARPGRWPPPRARWRPAGRPCWSCRATPKPWCHRTTARPRHRGGLLRRVHARALSAACGEATATRCPPPISSARAALSPHWWRWTGWLLRGVAVRRADPSVTCWGPMRRAWRGPSRPASPHLGRPRPRRCAWNPQRRDLDTCKGVIGPERLLLVADSRSR